MTTALDDLIQQRLTEVSVMKQANWHIYEQMLHETAAMLHSTPQLVQDVLHTVCVEQSNKPMVMLQAVHSFLTTFTAWQQHEAEPEQAESPFMSREEQVE